MAQWPPSPIVEDEATALAKEHGLETMSKEFKPEDHPVPSRGAVDQYPIICDSEATKESVIPVKVTELPPKSLERSSGKAQQIYGTSTSQDETGLQTPPSSDIEPRGRAPHLGIQNNKGEPLLTPRAKSVASTRNDEMMESRSRPSMSRIQTDVSGDIERMKAGTRRDPSPYSYTRQTGTFRIDPGTKRSTDQYLSPGHAAESPVTVQQPKVHQERQVEPRDHDSSTDSEKKPKKSLRFAEKPLGPAPPSQPRKSFSLPESKSQEKELSTTRALQTNDVHASHTPENHGHRVHRHRQVDDTVRESSNAFHGPEGKTSRSSSKIRESPHSSSAEESVKKERATNIKESSSEMKPARRRSSHRRERPRLEEPLSYVSAHARTESSDDDSFRKIYRVRDGRSPMTPPTVTTPNHMEDYFSRAFQENALKNSKYTPRSSADDTAVFSPPNSPPRTPRSERVGRREYFESPSSSPHRTPRGSRPPSLEESQIRDLRAHHSLLSQATAGAAAIAARISPPTTRSSSILDAAFENPNHVIVTKSRSRASSPVREVAKQASRVEQPVYNKPRSRAPSPQRESTKPVVHRAESMCHTQPRSRPPSPQREFTKTAVHRADSLGYNYPRSRASSPSRDALKPVIHTDVTINDEPTTTRTYHINAPQAKRPSTREGLPKLELPSHAPAMQPQRTASWTGYEHSYRPHGVPSPGPLHNMTPISTVLPPTTLKVPPPLMRSQSASSPADFARASDFALPPCPRSHPTQGLRDWVTIKDLPNFDVCPKCAHILASTQYRALLVRSLEKPYNKNTICALSKPWVRIAITRSIKQNKIDTDRVHAGNSLVGGARPCEGSEPDIRLWWRIADPASDRTVPNFFACSACMGTVHTIFPEVKYFFIKDDLNHEKVCDLRCNGKNFGVLAQQIEQVADKCQDRGKSHLRYVQPLIDTVRRLNRKECTKDKMLPHRAWHYMDQLPEFTICEGCFEEVVWPLKDRQYACDVSKVLKLVPIPSARSSNTMLSASTDGPATHLTSCQLYSDRMRRLFGDVVGGRIPWEVFKSKVKERQSTQHRLMEMNRMYEEDQRMGWDRRSEIEKNKAYWRSME